MRAFFSILIIFLLCSVLSFAQYETSFRRINLQLSDTVKLDTLSLVFGSVKIFDSDGNLLNSLCVRVDHVNAKIFVCDDLIGKDVVVEYSRMPLLLNKPYFHKQRKEFLIRDSILPKHRDIYVFNEGKTNFFNDSEISRRGSISRGISVGNNQDAILNSHLNLQISGKLSDDIEITAVISDNNIPIQPDGNTQQLQEFDKVYINLKGNHLDIVAGDFEEKTQRGYFLQYNKKVQGARIGINDIAISNKIKLRSDISGSVSKGKYRRQLFQAQEGVQGPYKLTGANNEMYIIVLAGTEKVYIDGQLLIRGLENDYVIDYNTGEISFTAKRPITKDKRIIAEFEYSERSYTRFLVTSTHNFETEKGNFWLNIYSEQDNKNQAFDQTLNFEDKKMLYEAGDNPLAAVRLNADSVGFSSNEIRYALIDTIVDGLVYDSVFVYSINPDKAFFRLGFSYVGSGKGNYIKSISAANGRVYEWVVPINGEKQGDYEPIVLLVSPKKKQAVSVGTKYNFGDKTILLAESAFSLNDLNTFSPKDANDDYGMATKFGIEQKLITNSTNQLNLVGTYQFVSKNFSEIENYREQEFSRNWNIGNLGINKGEHFANLGMKYRHKSKSFAEYNFTSLQRPSLYSGFSNQFVGDLNFNTWRITANANYLISNDTALNSNFLRHKAEISKNFKTVKIGIGEEAEENKRILMSSQLLADNSFSWNAFKAYLSSSDSTKQSFYLSYSNRTDNFAQFGELKKSSNAHDFLFNSQISDKKYQNLNLSVNYRKLTVFDASPEGKLPENNLTGRVEYSLKLLKNSLLFSSFYEIGSALERKTEFTYFEVAPGQGVYTWTDYNNNGVQELDEFEIAYYQDQANYIRYYTSTNEYIKAFANQFSQMINFRPSLKWRNAKGFAGFLTRFSNQFAYKINNKNTSENFYEYINPFVGGLNDSSLVSLNQSLRNEFSFNKNNPKLGFDYIFNNNSSKILLVNGFDTRNLIKHEIVGRFSIRSYIQANNKFAIGSKFYGSEYFASKNYKIDFVENIASISIQPNMQNRLSLIYKWKDKINSSGIETLNSHDIGLEYNLSSIKKGVLSAGLNYIFINYNGNSNSPVSYEMLEGLLPGNNITWQINFQRQLANGLQINLNYNGRAANNAKTIHSGGVQLRAYF